MLPEEQPSAGGWTTAVELPAHFTTPILLDMTTLRPRPIQAGVMRSLVDGQFHEYAWFSEEAIHRWRPITAEKAERLCVEAKVAEYRGVRHWLELFALPAPKEEGSARTKKHRATKEETLLKTYAAIAHKMARPAASEADCATAADIPRSTLAARPEWMEWSQMIERAAANGTLAKLKPAYDKRIDQIVATRE